MKRSVLLVLLSAVCLTWVSIPQTQAADEVVIGTVVPLSGGVANYGINTKRGLEMAAEVINAAGGIKAGGRTYMMRIEACDDEGKSDKAATCGRKLASMYKPPIIYTPASWSAFPMMGYNEKMNFIIMATSQSPPFTQKGNKLVIRWANSVEISMGPWVKLVLKHMKLNDLNVKKVGVMEVNTEVGKRWAEAFMREWKNNGGVITGKESFDANQTDYYAQLTSLLKESPDGIMVGVPDEPTSIVIKQARELGFKGIFICSAATDGGKLLQLIKPEYVENSFMEASAIALSGPGFDEFQKKYKAKYNEDAIFAASQSYEGGLAMKAAIEKAQSLEPSKIKAVFPSILPLPDCMYCARDMDQKTGELYMPIYLRMIKDGKVIGIKD